ncbi:MAG: hypothetical protein A2Y12_13545 [Planctomycetes bacterium GWF2_42_9]|nr:MAG: hypothetical protein A2Y12_13545 [Planctomycetes bacterium GWF2_42_9]
MHRIYDYIVLCLQYIFRMLFIKTKILCLLCCGCTYLTGSVFAGTDSFGTEFFFPATGISVKNKAVLLAIDELSLPLKNNVCFYISKPRVRTDAVLKPSRNDPNAPDYLGAFFYGTVIQDVDSFKMWYYAIHPSADKTGIVQGPICYAISADGINWTKPSLGQVFFNGSRKNNIIALPHTKGTEGVTVIKDIDDPDPNRLYKMAYNEWSTRPGVCFTIRTAVSADGLKWKPGPECPLGSFIEHASFYKYNNYYFVNGQTYDRSEGGDWGGRQAFVRLSPDFDHWLKESAPSFLLPEPASGRGINKNYRQVHLGIGAAPFGNVLVGLYGMWDQAGFGLGGTVCDLGIVVSNDGIHFREPVPGHVFISRLNSPAPAFPGKAYSTILCQSNGIINVGDETRIYHGRWRNVASDAPCDQIWGEIALATLSRDRWGALGLVPPLKGHPATASGTSEGAIWSAPIILPRQGCELILNADDADCIEIEIADDRFNLLPRFSGGNSAKTKKIKGGLDCPIFWPAGKLAEISGVPVRLKLNLKRKTASSEPRFFALYFNSK